MIRSITGTVTLIHPTYIVLEVQGIGYMVYTPQTGQYTLTQTLTLHTHLAVRENALDLYGFATLDDLDLFALLLSLPKIGPKSALQVMTQADSVLIKTAIASNDAAHLSKMSGIGKKTAEKIVLGLQDAFADYAYESVNTNDTNPTGTAPYMSDAIDALITLGYPQNDARKVIQQITAEVPQITNANDAVKEALKKLST